MPMHATTASNPKARLAKPPANGCLHEEDGRLFSDLLQIGRLAANHQSDEYPHLDEVNKLVAAYNHPKGMLVLTHLSAMMYSYWDNAPAGPAVYDLARGMIADADYARQFRREAFHWGTHRVNAPAHSHLVLVEDTQRGSIVADASFTKFYRVLGLMSSPARALIRGGLELPVRVRLTALPFRGVLVYDGLLGGPGSFPKLTTAERAKLARNYQKARKAGNIVTGLAVPAVPDPPAAPPSEKGLEDLDVAALRQFVTRRLGKLGDGSRGALLREAKRVREKPAMEKTVEYGPTATARAATSPSATGPAMGAEAQQLMAELKDLKKEQGDGMVVCRRFGYSEEENPNHVVVVMCGSMAMGMFTTAALVPSPLEVLREVVKLGRQTGSMMKMVAVDDAATARTLSEWACDAGVRFGFYPVPSEEEQALMTNVPPPVLQSLKQFGRDL